MANNRFTNDAKAVLQFAQDTAQKFHHDYVGTEHILLGLVLNKDGIAGLILSQLGLTSENVTRAIEQQVGWGTDTTGKLRLTPRTKPVSYTHLDFFDHYEPMQGFFEQHDPDFQEVMTRVFLFKNSTMRQRLDACLLYTSRCV